MSLPATPPPTPLPRPAWAARPGPRRSTPPGLRVGDAERSRVCEELSQHYSVGRLDPDELEERLSRAMAARTQGDLHRLTRDLPPLERPAAPPAPVRSAASAVVAGLVLLGSFTVCMLMILGSLLVAPGWAFGAVVGGVVAVCGGVAIGHLWHWSRG
ncbi:DUF1707 domain-containing protein [Auraticoccus sp. F435]|uniref:DUF1707 domain-containing protein n=1 Tax=Auraticoccus cholistanensis TaxID=2656650 RepID=A0A6A9V1Z9_9ACTN|nr:DUF1707 domain-containing protein [Auraticoccus cholistanensis]MVA77589.1 DUF1707 domain-containing protein [Auraticoccus cholistanensis]